MRKSATITINDKIITIHEITVRQMLNIKESLGNRNVLEALQELLPLLTDASTDFLLELAPSEIEEIYCKVKEVNASFFRVVPLDQILAGYKETVMQIIVSNLSKLSAQSLQQATGLPPGTTAGDYL